MLVENRSVPTADVVPVLAYPAVVPASEWLCGAFGFRVRLRIGTHRAQLVHGDGAVIVTHGDDAPAAHAVHVRGEDVDAHCERAAAGADVVSAPADYPYGERQYTAGDPAGRRWTFSQSIADVDPSD